LVGMTEHAVKPTPDRVAVYREVFGRLLMSRRRRAGLNVGALGKRASMSRGAVGRIEAGESSPNLEQLERLAVALGVSGAELLAQLRTAVGYLQSRGTVIVEGMPGVVTDRGRLVPPDSSGTVPVAALLRVSSVTLMYEVEAALGERPDPPRTPIDAFARSCRALGIDLPRVWIEYQAAAARIALAILDGTLDDENLVTFGPPDPLFEDSAFLEIDLDPGFEEEDTGLQEEAEG